MGMICIWYEDEYKFRIHSIPFLPLPLALFSVMVLVSVSIEKGTCQTFVIFDLREINMH